MRGGRHLVAALIAASLTSTLALPVSAADKDKDGLYDGFEQRYGLTSPNLRDSDHDGVIDSAEDNDGDRLGNLGEQRFRTNPGRRDTDGDGVPDGREDRNGNGISNAKEQDRRRLPANLRPSLATARQDIPPIRWRCLTPFRQAKPLVCKFGPYGASSRFVLVGDSHALVWSSPMRNVAVDDRWRFLTMTKSACPPLLGLYTKRQVATDGGVSCQRWRRNVIDRLNAYPPDLIVITHADTYALTTRSGEKIVGSRRTARWKAALKRTLDALPEESSVLVLGDVPRTHVNPRKCLKRHPADMSKCVTPRAAAIKRPIQDALRQTALENGAEFRTLNWKICSYDPCPVVQGDILLWRNHGHLTDTFAVKLQPAIRAILEPSLR